MGARADRERLSFYNGVTNTHLTLDVSTCPTLVEPRARQIMFMEKSLAVHTSIAGRQCGGRRHLQYCAWSARRHRPDIRYHPQHRRRRRQRAEYGATGRATYPSLPAQAPDYSLHIGADAEGSHQVPRPSAYGALTLNRTWNCVSITRRRFPPATAPSSTRSRARAFLAARWRAATARLTHKGAEDRTASRARACSDLDFHRRPRRVSYTLTVNRANTAPPQRCTATALAGATSFRWAAATGRLELAARYTRSLNHFPPCWAAKRRTTRSASTGTRTTIRLSTLNYIHGDIDKSATHQCRRHHECDRLADGQFASAPSGNPRGNSHLAGRKSAGFISPGLRRRLTRRGSAAPASISGFRVGQLVAHGHELLRPRRRSS